MAILRDLELKVTPPNQFNDPFDLLPQMVCSNPHQYAKRLLKNEPMMKKFHAQLVAGNRFRGSFRDFREHLQRNRSALLESQTSFVPLSVASVQTDWMDIVSTMFGVLCMSSERTSIVMWGHYADKHKGLVIGFDRTAEPFRTRKGFRPVNYVKRRVIYDAIWQPGSTELQRYEDEILLSKNEEWDYEKEERDLFKLSQLKTEPLDDGTRGFFLPIPASAIVSVSLGFKASTELKTKVQSMLQAHGILSTVKVEQAKLHDSDFALKFE